MDIIHEEGFSPVLMDGMPDHGDQPMDRNTHNPWEFYRIGHPIDAHFCNAQRALAAGRTVVSGNPVVRIFGVAVGHFIHGSKKPSAGDAAKFNFSAPGNTANWPVLGALVGNQAQTFIDRGAAPQ